MLIEFSVTNYLSFRETATFSMAAATRLKKKENTFIPLVDGEKLPALLKVVAVYGPNASGKSNLIKALGIFHVFALLKPSATPSALPVTPFRFDPALRDQPSRFEVHFVTNRQRYQFDLAATTERIVEERLTAFPKGKETLLYERKYGSQGEEYQFGEKLEGGKELHQAWRKLTGPQVLFITQAVANSSEELQQLRTPFMWLEKGMLLAGTNMRNWAHATQALARDFPHISKEISAFLKDLDVPIAAIKFNDEGPRFSEIKKLTDEDLADEKQREIFEAAHLNKTTLTHSTALGTADFSFDEESDGTKGLMGFWLPWDMVSTAELKGMKTLIVDELDSSLHPEIVRALVSKLLKFDSPVQLIFTTHDTHLMNTRLLRRDQFWLTERDINGATALRSIHDFEGREGEDIEKRYFHGRYRSLPLLRKD